MTLCGLVEKAGDLEGYEGNAQSFRIITKLAVRFEETPGLDLTRATLGAILKYPWIRDTKDQKKSKKWSVYKSETDDFIFASELIQNETKTLEAELMDWADDIAYSVHDLEDFHRCGAIPWHLLNDQNYQLKLVADSNENWFNAPEGAYQGLHEALITLGKLLGSVSELRSKPYEGTRKQRHQIRFLTSTLIGRFIRGLNIRDRQEVGDGQRCVIIDFNRECEVRILKQITQDFIISNPALAAQQRGHRRLLEELFEDILEEVITKPDKRDGFLPTRLKYLLDDGETNARITADCISSFTEAEAIALHGRIRGTASGSVLDPIVR